MSVSPYADAPPEKLAEIIRLAESRLQAQLTLGIAADQRAMTMATILTATAGVFIGFSASQKEVSVVLIVLIAGFALASIFAVFAALPSAWHAPGNEPSQWLEDIPSGDTLHNGFAAMAGYYDNMIEANQRNLDSAAFLVRSAFISVVVTLPLAGAAVVLS